MDRRLIFVTLIFLALCLGFLIYKQVTTGFFIEKGSELKGGNLINIYFKDADFSKVSSIADNIRDQEIAAYPVTTSLGPQLSIETSREDIEKLIEKINSTAEIKSYEINKVDPKISTSLITEIMKGIILAFAAMAIVIFLLFRTPIPSFAVILAAFSDLVMTVFLMNILGIQLTMATFIALLMLLGYSVDTDILLTSKTLKEKGNFNANYKEALKTGLTMTTTSIIALIAIILITGYSSVFGQLAMVIILGLLVDIPNTWIQNAAILSWYKEKFNK